MSINFNGKTYNSVDEMPPNVRMAYNALIQAFADNDHNGMPDIFEGKADARVVNLGNVLTSQSNFHVMHDGKSYTNLNELPPEVRSRYDQAMSKLNARFGDQNQNGMPDILESANPGITRATTAFASQVAQPIPATTTSVPGSGNNDTRMLLLGITIVVLLLIVIALVAVLIFGSFLFKS